MKNVALFKKNFSQLFVVATGIIVTIATMSHSTNYYVDNSIGNDNNSGTGTTSALAWKTLENPSNKTFAPGDSILFKAGGVWEGQLYNWGKANGSASLYIVFDKYGTGAKPLIRNNVTSEVAAIFMRDNSYFEVNNLELTCPNGAFGIKILTGATATCNVNLNNLTVHNVNGLKARDGQRQYGGIVYKNGVTTKGSIKIINCTIYDVRYNGIEFGNHSSIALPDISTKSYNNKIENCTIYNCGLNGIWFSDAINSLISNCTIYNCGLDNTQQSPSTTILLRGNSKTTVQNCEIYNNKKAGIGLDFEALSSRDCIIQYNYFHDNAGGIFNINSSTTTTASTGNIFRYNVCQNNGGTLFSLSNATTTLVHNNSLYSTSTTSISKGFSSTSGSSNNKFNNNIFYLNSSASYDAGATWDYNCFFGTHSGSEPTDANKKTTDPQFKSAGSGSVGRSTADGYILKTTSPCINNGLLISSAGTKDFWGNPVPHNGKMNIGAYDGVDGNVSIAPGVNINVASPSVFSLSKDGSIAASIANSGRYTLSIISLNGKMLLEKRGIAPEHITLPANSVPSGAHLARLDIGGQSFTRAIMAVR